MPTPASPPRSIPELLAALRAAVRARDHNRASELEQAILRRLAEEAAARPSAEQKEAQPSAVEQQVAALMAELATARPQPPRDEKRLPRKNSFGGPEEVRGAALPEPAGWPTSAPVPDQDLLFPVWFGTNRQPTADGRGFTAAPNATTTRGRVEVRIPPAHRTGETGSGFWTKLKRLDFRDDHLRVEHLTAQDEAAFFADLQRAVNGAKGETHALLFIHGYNNSFEEAAIRAAQLGFDLKVNGPTAFFSWPSGGSVTAYMADEAAIEASEAAITEFIVDFATRCRADKLHVIAHSMGNRGLLRSLQRIAGQAELQGKVRFDQIFLAAPDVDRALFLSLASVYPNFAKRTTLYASQRDIPVHLSFWVHKAPRAGYFVPYTVAPKIDTVAVPNFNVDLLGHAYFAQAIPLLRDIGDLMRHNDNPAQRQQLEDARYEGEDFWRFRR